MASTLQQNGVAIREHLCYTSKQAKERPYNAIVWRQNVAGHALKGRIMFFNIYATGQYIIKTNIRQYSNGLFYIAVTLDGYLCGALLLSI